MELYYFLRKTWNFRDYCTSSKKQRAAACMNHAYIFSCVGWLDDCLLEKYVKRSLSKGSIITSISTETLSEILE